MEIIKEDERLSCLINRIRNCIPNFFLLSSGYPRNPFYIPASYRVFSLILDDSNNPFVLMRTEPKGRQYNLLNEDDLNKFVSELKEFEIPKYITKELLKDSYDNRLKIEAYLSGSEEDDIQEIRINTYLSKLCVLICDHWEHIQKIKSRLIVSNDSEIDELEDFRGLANKIRVYLRYLNSLWYNTDWVDIYKKEFTEPEYVFV